MGSNSFPREAYTIPMLELGRRTAKPCMGLVCVNGKRHLALAEAASLGGWWDTCRGVNCVSCPMGITAGGRGARCWPWGRAWAEVSKGCLSQKHWPMYTRSCLTKRSKEERTLFSLASVGLLVRGSRILRELGFAHLVEVEHGVSVCWNICQL